MNNTHAHVHIDNYKITMFLPRPDGSSYKESKTDLLNLDAGTVCVTQHNCCTWRVESPNRSFIVHVLFAVICGIQGLLFLILEIMKQLSKKCLGRADAEQTKVSSL